MDLAARLRSISAEIKGLRTEASIIDEQIAFQTDVAEDARIRALVSETPLAEREAQQAREDLARLIRSRDEVLERLEGMRQEQDGLLERMLAEPTDQGGG